MFNNKEDSPSKRYYKATSLNRVVPLSKIGLETLKELMIKVK